MEEKKNRILLVEDEESLQKMIRLNLEMDGFEVVSVDNGRDALEKARGERFDMIILDVMLPHIDGFTVCKTLRVEGSKVPILFLTARQTSQDRVEGLKIGADDYLTKPFNLEELLLRVTKLIERTAKKDKDIESDIYQFGDCEINFKTYKIKDLNGEEVELPKRELMLLKLLVSKEGQVVSREEILETVWGYDVFPSTRTVDNYVMALRKYFEKNPRQPKHIHSVRGVGYRFQP
jgi:two-component system alkaline phosphatase synthesis response regulator PhoP